MLLITTNGVLEDQSCSVPIPKQKLNPWEQKKQFYKLSCCSGPLKAPPGGSCLAVLWEAKHVAKFVSGQATFSSNLITEAVAFRLSGDVLSHCMHPAVICPFLRLELSRQGRKSWRKAHLPPESGSTNVSFTLQTGTNVPRSAQAASLVVQNTEPPSACPVGCARVCEFSQVTNISPFQRCGNRSLGSWGTAGFYGQEVTETWVSNSEPLQIIYQSLINSIYELSYPIRGLRAKKGSHIVLLDLILPPTRWVGFHKEVRNSFLIAEIIPTCNKDFLLKLSELSCKGGAAH